MEFIGGIEQYTRKLAELVLVEEQKLIQITGAKAAQESQVINEALDLIDTYIGSNAPTIAIIPGSDAEAAARQLGLDVRQIDFPTYRLLIQMRMKMIEDTQWASRTS